MQVQVDIAFEQILRIVKALPEAKKKQLRDELDKQATEISPSIDLKALLLEGPVATEKQLELIENNRKAINQWRKR